jgi:hypothetical protein
MHVTHGANLVDWDDSGIEHRSIQIGLTMQGTIRLTFQLDDRPATRDDSRITRWKHLGETAEGGPCLDGPAIISMALQAHLFKVGRRPLENLAYPALDHQHPSNLFLSIQPMGLAFAVQPNDSGSTFKGDEHDRQLPVSWLTQVGDRLHA